MNYVADEGGFRVSGTTLPVAHYALPTPVEELPEVKAAREEHLRLVAEEKARQAEALAAAQAEAAAQPQVEAVPAEPQAYVQPQPAAVAPQQVVVHQQPQVYVQPQVQVQPQVVATVPVAVAPQNHQFHSQDDIGQYSYGYSNFDSQKSETKTADGIVRGTYSYMDANGVVQQVNYVSDALGFR